MRHVYSKFPEHFFIELRAGSNSNWEAYSRDNDRDTMELRFTYQSEMLKPGGGVRMLDCAGKILKEKTI